MRQGRKSEEQEKFKVAWVVKVMNQPRCWRGKQLSRKQSKINRKIMGKLGG